MRETTCCFSYLLLYVTFATIKGLNLAALAFVFDLNNSLDTFSDSGVDIAWDKLKINVLK